MKKLRGEKNMRKVESKNYIFNYNEGSVAEKQLEKIINIQETCFEFICNTLEVNMPCKINYYLCDSPEQVGEIFGDNEPCNAFACEPNNIYAVYNEEIKCIGFHEDAHVISYNTLSIPPQTFIREGLAMFFDKGYLGIPNYNWVNYFIDNNLYVNITKLVDNEEFKKVNFVITYTIAGAFTEYLLLSFGIDTYKEFYSNLNDDIEGSFQKAFKNSLEDMENNFLNYLKSLKNNEDINELLKKYCKRCKIV